ncbi:MAG: aminotransferase class V-fold PLP-dependent enzyme [Saprospiraceae bacterium]|nr:aminotransferase class V-fold PLP-dependent enzyme [Saprospiraceae bacterium]
MPDIAQLRAETPGCAHRIHLNNAGSALPPEIVLRTMQEYLLLEAQIGGYEAADARQEALAGYYTAVARLLNTQTRNVAFANSATDAYAHALSAIPFVAGDLILTTENDYVSNQIAFLSLQKRWGIQLLRAAESPEGGVDVADMERLIRQHRAKLVAVTHVPTSSGLVQPIEAIGQICRAEGLWYLVDACQSAGQLVLDVERIGCDFLTATMRKFLRGPRGAGFLYTSDRALEAGLEMLLPDMYGAIWLSPDEYQSAPTARRFEYFEMAPALVLGSKAAVEYALELGPDWIAGRVSTLADYTRQLLAALPGVQVLDRGRQRCGIVTAHCPAWDTSALLDYMWQRRINVRVSPPHVARYDFPKKGVDWVLRVSPHYYNTEQEIEEAVAAIGAFSA